MADENSRILAVDDENDILLIVKTALESEGFQVQTAASGEEALEVVADFTPDLMILDLMMPGLDGMETLQKMRDLPSTRTTPAIMLTGVSERKTILNALNRGVSHYIVKPFECDDLIAKVQKVLKETRED
jgi:two-component system phosphate regulon response regulator PhoB